MQSLHWLRSPLLLAAVLVAVYTRVPHMIPRSGSASRPLQAHPSSVHAARRIVREALTLARRDDLVDAAQLLVSEMVTNALVHAGTPIDLRVSIEGGGLRVEVTDGSTQPPVPRSYGPMAGTGRGLRLLEQLVDRWGTLAHEDGKTVWFELSSGERLEHVEIVGEIADDAQTENRQGDSDEGVVNVALHKVPLLLHAAWLQHAEALLREYLLASLDVDDADTAMDATEALETHAAASGAISLLHQHIPEPELGQDPETLLATAVEPHVSAEHLLMRVPRSSVWRFAVLDETLEAALVLADSGVLLTPPIQPELRELRRWLCGQVLGAHRGEPPTAWSADTSAAPPPMLPPVSWDENVVNAADEVLIAADDSDQIVAVSRAACDLLGYPDPDQLLGRRLVAIIPPRYHQAHLAGFTLHLVNGRSPLLGRSVTVPILCRDGTERMADLEVASHQMPGGRHLFIAKMRPRPGP
ncbi:MAG: PAS domain S-box protein [Actinomycetota bacterium]|nr:PAS domain S-box protein [Actinomycetota bacterium]